MTIKKPENFTDLLYLQELLDKTIEQKRSNGFVPRQREEIDILLAVDDELQEWLRELPKQYNFKTWKQKEYDRKKELEELTDILFFFLQYFNHKKEFIEKLGNEIDKREIKEKLQGLFEAFSSPSVTDCKLETKIYIFKHVLWSKEIIDGEAFKMYLDIVMTREFSVCNLMEAYWEKWQKNMKRINEDWLISESKVIEG